MKQAFFRRKAVRFFLLPLFAILFILISFNFKMLIYGYQQLEGQLHIISNSHDIEEFIACDSISDSLKTKLQLVISIRNYAFDSIGLDPSNNYSKVYDQQNKPSLWAITACKPFDLEAYEWDYLFLGKMPYKGFFKQELVEKELAILKKLDLDVNSRPVSAWSTLGWFTDPILTNFLKRSEGSIAELIIHELTHSTLYIKDNVTFNENLANFIGEEGAIRFLKSHFGESSPELTTYLQQFDDHKTLCDFVLSQSNELEKLYNDTFFKKLTLNKKNDRKNQFMEKFKSELAQLPFKNKSWNEALKKSTEEINNTYFMSFRRYNQDQNTFKIEFEQKFGKDFDKYLQYLRKKYA